MKLRRPLTLLAAAGALLLPACGSDDDSGSPDSSGSDAAEPAALAITATESGKKVSLDTPAKVDAGLTEITLENSGKKPHEAQLVRVDGDQSADQVVEEVLDTGEGAPTPDWAHGGGGVGPTGPGQSRTATQVLEPGTYYVADTENAGKGAIAKFEVTGEASGELPATDATIVAEDYTFEATGLKAGKNEITFDNVGKELHHAIAFPLKKGATVGDAAKVFGSDKPPSGPPPVDFEGFTGTTVLDGGDSQVTSLDLKKGKYVLVCFISDRSGGPPHVAKGMIAEATVE